MECRLCSSTVELMDTFISSGGDYLRKVIHLAAGVEILKDDLVSKSICRQCLSMTVNLQIFRIQASRNDNLLKMKSGLTANTINLNNILKDNIKESPNKMCRIDNKNIVRPPKALLPKFFHETTEKVLKTYPSIIIPYAVMNKHISPKVILAKLDIEDSEKSPNNKRGRKRKIKHDTCKINAPKQYRYNPQNILRINTRASAAHKSLKKLDLPEVMPGNLTGVQDIFISSLELLRTNVIPVAHEPIIPQFRQFESILPKSVVTNPRSNGQMETTSQLLVATSNGVKNNTKSRVLPINRTIPNIAASINSASTLIDEISSTSDHGSTITDDMYGDMGVDADDDDVSVTSNHQEFPFETSLLMAGKSSDAVHLCNICNKMFPTKRKLKVHTKTHNTCCYCKTRCKNFADLQKHINTTCTLTYVKKPILELVKCDEDPEILKKYPSVFKYVNPKPNTYVIKNTLASKDSFKITLKKPKSVSTGTDCPNVEEVNSNPGNAMVEFNSMSNESMEGSPAISEPAINEDVVCISDDEDSEDLIFSTQAEQVEILQIFKQHTHMLADTADALTQAYFPSPNFQPTISDNNTLFEDMYRDLKTGKIPINVITTSDSRDPHAEIVFYAQNSKKPDGMFDWSSQKAQSIKPVGCRENKQKSLPVLTKIPTKHNKYRPDISNNVLQNSPTNCIPQIINTTPQLYQINKNIGLPQNSTFVASAAAPVTNILPQTIKSTVGTIRVKSLWELNTLSSTSNDCR